MVSDRTLTVGSEMPRGTRDLDGRVQVERRGLPMLAATGATLGLCLAALLGATFTIDRTIFAGIVAVLAATFLGGRLPGIVAGIEVGFDGWTTVFLLALLNTAWLLVAVPAMIGAWRGVAGWRWLARFREATGERASRQAATVSRHGSWALPLYIWLPFPLTGAVVGAAIGLLLGVPLRRLMILVLLSMWTGIVMWTFGMEYLFLFGGLAGRVVGYGITAAALFYAAALRLRRAAP